MEYTNIFNFQVRAIRMKGRSKMMKTACIALGILGGFLLLTVLCCMFMSIGKRADEAMERYFTEKDPEEDAEQKEGR